jgi:hypothetical protein
MGTGLCRIGHGSHAAGIPSSTPEDGKQPHNPVESRDPAMALKVIALQQFPCTTSIILGDL